MKVQKYLDLERTLTLLGRNQLCKTLRGEWEGGGQEKRNEGMMVDVGLTNTNKLYTPHRTETHLSTGLQLWQQSLNVLQELCEVLVCVLHIFSHDIIFCW